MNAEEKIQKARNIIMGILNREISNLSLNKLGKELQISLVNGILIYIVYNDYSQYSYSIIYSNSKLDRKRFDNYDDKWDVNSRPHHFHTRNSLIVRESPMKGDPENDISLLINEL